MDHATQQALWVVADYYLGENLLLIMADVCRYFRTLVPEILKRHQYLRKKYQSKFAYRAWGYLIKHPFVTVQTSARLTTDIMYGDDIIFPVDSAKLKVQSFVTAISVIMRDNAPFYYGMRLGGSLIAAGHVREDSYLPVWVHGDQAFMVTISVQLQVNSIPVIDDFGYTQMVITPNFEVDPHGNAVIHPDREFCEEFLHGFLITYARKAEIHKESNYELRVTRRSHRSYITRSTESHNVINIV